MTTSYLILLGAVALLALLPVALKWIKHKLPAHAGAVSAAQPKLLGALAVGTHQRVVTVEVGQGVDRVWLVLGVANESVQCLHKMAPTPQPQPQPQPGLGTVNAKA